VPVNAPDDRPTRITVDDAATSSARPPRRSSFGREPVHAAGRNPFAPHPGRGGRPEMTLGDSIANMRVIDAVFRSERSGGWEPV